MNSVLAARHLLNSRNVRVRSSTIRVASIWSERMQSIEIAKPPCGSPTHNRAGSLRSWIGDRRVLAVAGLAVTGTGPLGRLGLAHRCRTRAADRVGSTSSNYVRARCVHDGKKPLGLFQPPRTRSLRTA